MAGRGKAHSLKGTKTSMAGIPISGYAEDGSIQAEPTNDAGEVVVGADGEQSVFCFDHSNNFTVTLQLMETSRTVFLLDTAFKLQRELAANGLPSEVPFSYWNPRIQERVSTNTAFFQAQPTRGAARKVGVREYKIAVLNANTPPPAGNLV